MSNQDRRGYRDYFDPSPDPDLAVAAPRGGPPPGRFPDEDGFEYARPQPGRRAQGDWPQAEEFRRRPSQDDWYEEDTGYDGYAQDDGFDDDLDRVDGTGDQTADHAQENAADLAPPSSRLNEERAHSPAAWHAGADLGLLVLRLALGGLFVLRGTQKVFGVLGGPGIDGFADYLQSVGFRETTILAWGTGITELLGGALLIVGLLTPAAASALLAVTSTAVLVNFADGFFQPDGVEYPLVLAVLAFVALFAGPGRVSLDRGRAWFRRPMLSGVLFLLLAAGVTVTAEFVLR